MPHNKQDKTVYEFKSKKTSKAPAKSSASKPATAKKES